MTQGESGDIRKLDSWLHRGASALALPWTLRAAG
jgi:hypothetical protein